MLFGQSAIFVSETKTMCKYYPSSLQSFFTDNDTGLNSDEEFELYIQLANGDDTEI